MNYRDDTERNPMSAPRHAAILPRLGVTGVNCHSIYLPSACHLVAWSAIENDPRGRIVGKPWKWQLSDYLDYSREVLVQGGFADIKLLAPEALQDGVLGRLSQMAIEFMQPLAITRSGCLNRDRGEK